MKKNMLFAPFAALFALSPVLAQQPAETENPGPAAIVDSAPADAWKAIAARDLLVMDLAPDAAGEPRRVIIQLIAPPFSQGWVGNIRKLAAAHWWDGTSINRVQDNYVVQWGDAGYDNPESGETTQKSLPDGLESVPESEYMVALEESDISAGMMAVIESSLGLPGHNDAYSFSPLWWNGWPLGTSRQETAWPVHCYGTVGVGRNLSPDTGTGAELYAVIGHAPRHLDRNIAVVGRVIEGIEHLSSLPRGKGQLGFYTDAEKRVPIRSIRTGDALPKAEQPQFEYLDTNSAYFYRYAKARANRRDAFFITPAGGVDICNVPVPVRRVTAGG